MRSWLGWTVLLSVIALATALQLIYGAWCAMTWFKHGMADYGNYVNMIWNTGHGHPFKLRVDGSYLSYHLSFTLGALGLFYHLWNHAFLLALLQGLMVLGGALLLVRAALRQNLDPAVAAALAVFFIGYPFTQRLMLSDFHGVAAYYVLFPWLYYAACFHKKAAWLPWLLILGVREDAFIFALPALAYLSARDRWRGGWYLCLGGVLYGILALTVLYPWLGQAELAAQRSAFSPQQLVLNWQHDPAQKWRYIQAFIWTALPLLTCIRLSAWPALIFPLTAYASTLVSGSYFQVEMRQHYGGPTLVCLAVGLLEAWAQARHRRGPALAQSLRWRSVALVLIVLLAHARHGLIWGGGKESSCYMQPHPEGRAAFWASRFVPPEGTLVVDHELGGFFSHRSDIQVWHRWDPEHARRDLVFGRITRLDQWAGGAVTREYAQGWYGARYFDGTFVLLEQGFTGPDDAFIRLALDNPGRRFAFAETQRHAGDNRYTRGATEVRYWDGNGHRTPVTIAFGHAITLPAGSWQAWVRYRMERPRRKPHKDWARFELYPLGQPDRLYEAEFDRVASPPDTFRVQAFPFELGQETRVEPRIVAGHAALWLDQIVFAPALPPQPRD